MTIKTPTLLSIGPIVSESDIGITSDLKTFAAFGCYGLSIPTGFINNKKFIDIPIETFTTQLENIIRKFDINGIHISYINRTPELIEPLINNITKFKQNLIVLDLTDTENENLDQIKSLIKECNVFISTINESIKLTGINIKNNMGIKAAAKKINILGADNVIISDNEFNNEEVIDYLYDGSEYLDLAGERNNFNNTSGIGSCFSAAITASLSYKRDIVESTAIAKNFTFESTLSSHNLNNSLKVPNPLHNWWINGGNKGYG